MHFAHIFHVQTLSFVSKARKTLYLGIASAQEEANKSFYFQPNMHTFVLGCLTRVCLLYEPTHVHHIGIDHLQGMQCTYECSANLVSIS